jgi:hypothetical protein
MIQNTVLRTWEMQALLPCRCRHSQLYSSDTAHMYYMMITKDACVQAGTVLPTWDDAGAAALLLQLLAEPGIRCSSVHQRCWKLMLGGKRVLHRQHLPGRKNEHVGAAW